MHLNHEIKYGVWIIATDDSYQSIYEWRHDGYDGAPDANDTRCGKAWTIDECIGAINEYEAEQ